MNPTIEVTRQVWQEVLKSQAVADEDDFFDIGGHSLTAMQVSAQLKEHYGVKVPTRLLFTHRRLADYAAAVEERVVEAAPVGGQ